MYNLIFFLFSQNIRSFSFNVILTISEWSHNVYFLITTATFVYFIGIFFIIFNRQNFLITMLFIEVMYVGVFIVFIASFVFLNDPLGQVYILVLLAIVGWECIVGLGILFVNMGFIIYYIIRKFLQNNNFIKIYTKWQTLNWYTRVFFLSIISALLNFIYVFLIIDGLFVYFILRWIISILIITFFLSPVKTNVIKDVKYAEKKIYEKHPWLKYTIYIYLTPIFIQFIINFIYPILLTNNYFKYFFNMLLTFVTLVFIFEASKIWAIKNPLPEGRRIVVIFYKGRFYFLGSLSGIGVAYKTTFGYDAALPPVRFLRKWRYGIYAETDSEYFLKKAEKFKDIDRDQEALDFWKKRLGIK